MSILIPGPISIFWRESFFQVSYIKINVVFNHWEVLKVYTDKRNTYLCFIEDLCTSFSSGVFVTSSMFKSSIKAMLIPIVCALHAV